MADITVGQSTSRNTNKNHNTQKKQPKKQRKDNNGTSGKPISLRQTHHQAAHYDAITETKVVRTRVNKRTLTARAAFAACLLTVGASAFVPPLPTARTHERAMSPRLDKATAMEAPLFGGLRKTRGKFPLLYKIGVDSEATRDPRHSFIYKIDKALDRFQARSAHGAKDFFLGGNYAPVAEEHRAVPMELVEGSLPADLDGLFVRNGPNPIPGQSSKPSHWFDGHGMLHCVRIQKGGATYSNSYIPTPRYEVEKAAGEDIFIRQGESGGLLGLTKCLCIEENLGKAAGMDPKELYTANNNAVMFRDRFLCLHEAGFPFEVRLSDDGSIEAGVGYETFQGSLQHRVAAHSNIDPVTGNFLIHSYMQDGPLIASEVSAESARVEQQCGGQHPFSLIPSHVSVTHGVLFTENWRLVFDTPLRMDPSNMLRGGKLFRWADNHSLQIGLIPRGGNNESASSAGDVEWVDTGKHDIVFHPMNAWEEEDGTVVFWSPVSERFEIEFDGKDEVDRNMPFHMVEYRIHHATGAVERTLISDKFSIETPKVRPDYLGRFSRYGFAGISTQDPSLQGTFAGITIWDLQEKKLHASIHFKDGETGSEPVLIPKPGKFGSNEVYVATYIHNVHEDQSYFQIFDGETGSSEPIARFRIPHRVPVGFHGLWVEGTELGKHVARSRLAE